MPVLTCVGLLALYVLCRNYTGAVIISGASTGIGLHAALSMADEGYVVYAGVRKDADAARLSSYGKPTLVPILLDVAQPESVDRCDPRLRAWKSPMCTWIVNAFDFLRSLS